MNSRFIFVLFFTLTSILFAQQNSSNEEELELWNVSDSIADDIEIHHTTDSSTPLRYVVELPLDTALIQKKIRSKSITGVSLISAGVPLTIIGIATYTPGSDTTLFPYSQYKRDRDTRITSVAFSIAGVVTTTVGIVTLIRTRRMKKWHEENTFTVAPLIYPNEKSFSITFSYSFSL